MHVLVRLHACIAAIIVMSVLLYRYMYLMQVCHN